MQRDNLEASNSLSIHTTFSFKNVCQRVVITLWLGSWLQAFVFFFQSVLCWSIAVSTICHHLSRVVAFLQAVARPKFRGLRSASIAWSQVWLGLPAGRFQSGGTCRIDAARARWWSSRGGLWAIWPKSRRHLLSHQVRKQWTTSGSSDFRIWHMASIW